LFAAAVIVLLTKLRPGLSSFISVVAVLASFRDELRGFCDAKTFSQSS